MQQARVSDRCRKLLSCTSSVVVMVEWVFMYFGLDGRADLLWDWGCLGMGMGMDRRFGLMDTEVIRKERKKSRRAQDDVNAQEAQPTEYTNKVG